MLRRVRQSLGLSIAQSCQQGDTSFDPVLLSVLLLHWQVEVEDEVGGVTGGGERTCSSGGLVNWALVSVAIIDLVPLARQNPNALHGGEELPWLRFLEGFLLLVPSGTFRVQSVDVNTIFWRFA